jgi:hypothetical protein
MAAFHGKLGEAWFNDTKATEVTNWAISTTADMAEYTGMQATDNAKTYLAGFLDWTATATVLVDGLDWDYATEFGATATLVLYGSTKDGELAKRYTGTAILTGMNTDLDKDGVGTINYSFQGSGTLTEQTDAAA